MMRIGVLAGAIALGVCSYGLTNPALVWLLAESKPWVIGLMGWIEYVNSHRLVAGAVMVFFCLSMLGVQIKLLFLETTEANSWFWLAVVIGVICAFSYPFLSKDIFTYLFSSKQLGQYGQNPYLIAPAQWAGKDLWIDLLGNVDNVYVYGPVYLVYALIPLLVFGYQRLVAAFFGLKLMNLAVFVLGGLWLMRWEKQKERVAAYWFFNPFLLMELVVNGHNDLLMVVLALAAIMVAGRDKMWRWPVWVMSVATKFVSLAMVPIWLVDEEKTLGVGRWLLVLLWVGLAIKQGNLWYFTWLYMLIPIVEIKSRLTWAGLMVWQVGLMGFGYLPFLLSGSWIVVPWMDRIKVFYFLLPLVFLFFDFGWDKRIRPRVIKARDIS